MIGREHVCAYRQDAWQAQGHIVTVIFITAIYNWPMNLKSVCMCALAHHVLWQCFVFKLYPVYPDTDINMLAGRAELCKPFLPMLSLAVWNLEAWASLFLWIRCCYCWCQYPGTQDPCLFCFSLPYCHIWKYVKSLTLSHLPRLIIHCSLIMSIDRSYLYGKI